jgi:hypothetical protein
MIEKYRRKRVLIAATVTTLRNITACAVNTSLNHRIGGEG